jgi:hypothetical protein
MSNYRAIHTQVLFAGLEVDGYEMNTGVRGFSLRGLAAMCGTSESNVRGFLNSKAFKALQGMDLNVRHFFKSVVVNHSKVTSITFVTCALATEFILQQALKGNELAADILRAITQVSLEARLQQAFTGVEMPEEARVSKELDIKALQDARFATKCSHSAFLNSCYRHHYPAGTVHDAITSKVAGMTAEEARQLEMVLTDDNPDVGLAHYSDAALLMSIANAKQKFSTLRTGTWQEKVSKL